MTTERFYFDFDAIEANGPYSKVPPYFFPPLTGFVEEVVGPYLRERDRIRRILVDGAIQNLALAGDRMRAQLQFDGGERPRLIGALIEGEVPAVYARDIRITPLSGDTTTEREES